MEQDQERAPVSGGGAAQARVARPTCPRSRRVTYPALGALLLVASTLGAYALSPSHDSLPRTNTLQTIPLGLLPHTLALDPDGGTAFVADDARATVSVLDLTTGHVVRTVAVGQPGVLAPLALDARTQRLFATTSGDAGVPSVVRVLDSRSGAPLRAVRVGPGATALAVDERAGHVVVTTEGDGAVSMLDARTGAVLRKAPLGFAPQTVAVDPSLARAFVAGWYELPVPSPRPGQVTILDTRTGALLGSVTVGNAPEALAVDGRTARVFVANGGESMVSVLDARTGALLRAVTVGLHPDSVTVDERRGRVFVVNGGDGTVSVLDARSGAVLHTWAVFPASTPSVMTQRHALAVDAARDRVYVTAWAGLDSAGLPVGSGRLAVLDARDGRPLRTIAIGVAPQAVAVEPASGRVVVVNSASTIRTQHGWAERWLAQVASHLRWLHWLGALALRAPGVIQVPGSLQVIDPRA